MIQYKLQWQYKHTHHSKREWRRTTSPTIRANYHKHTHHERIGRTCQRQKISQRLHCQSGRNDWLAEPHHDIQPLIWWTFIIIYNNHLIFIVVPNYIIVIIRFHKFINSHGRQVFITVHMSQPLNPHTNTKQIMAVESSYGYICVLAFGLVLMLAPGQEYAYTKTHHRDQLADHNPGYGVRKRPNSYPNTFELLQHIRVFNTNSTY